jgi:hypothetical protein
MINPYFLESEKAHLELMLASMKLLPVYWATHSVSSCSPLDREEFLLYLETSWSSHARIVQNTPRGQSLIAAFLLSKESTAHKVLYVITTPRSLWLPWRSFRLS